MDNLFVEIRLILVRTYGKLNAQDSEVTRRRIVTYLFSLSKTQRNEFYAKITVLYVGGLVRNNLFLGFFTTTYTVCTSFKLNSLISDWNKVRLRYFGISIVPEFRNFSHSRELLGAFFKLEKTKKKKQTNADFVTYVFFFFFKLFGHLCGKEFR